MYQGGKGCGSASSSGNKGSSRSHLKLLPCGYPKIPIFIVEAPLSTTTVFRGAMGDVRMIEASTAEWPILDIKMSQDSTYVDRRLTVYAENRVKTYLIQESLRGPGW